MGRDHSAPLAMPEPDLRAAGRGRMPLSDAFVGKGLGFR